MSAAEELADLIRGIDGPSTLGGLEVAEAILAAGYQKPRTDEATVDRVAKEWWDNDNHVGLKWDSVSEDMRYGIRHNVSSILRIAAEPS